MSHLLHGSAISQKPAHDYGGCLSPEVEHGGEACILQRQRGACKPHKPGSSLSVPGRRLVGGQQQGRVCCTVLAQEHCCDTPNFYGIT